MGTPPSDGGGLDDGRELGETGEMVRLGPGPVTALSGSVSFRQNAD